MSTTTSTRKAASRRTKLIPRDIWEQWLLEFPWLKQYETKGVAKKKKRVLHRRPGKRRRHLGIEPPDDGDGSPPPSSSETDDDVEVEPEFFMPEDELSEDELREIHEGLVEKRRNWHYVAGGTGQFYLLQRGGAWTVKHKGKLADAAAGLARAGCPRAWAGAFGWNKMKSFSYAKYGGERNANELAREWCRMSDYVYGIYFDAAAGRDDAAEGFTYTEAELNGYPDNYEFITWLSGLRMTDKAYDAGQALRGLRPR